MKKKPLEFSKIILMVAGAINIIVIAFTLVIVWRTLDLTPLAYLIPSVGAEVRVPEVLTGSFARRIRAS